MEVHGAGLDPTNYYDVTVSTDGRWLVVSASAGTAPRDDVWIADRSTAGGGTLREVQFGVDARCWAWVAIDGLLYLLTDRDAPRGRLCRTDPTNPGYEGWVDVVPETPDAVLSTVALVSSGPGTRDVAVILAAHTRDACDRMSWWDASAGSLLGTVPEPAAGSIISLSSRPEGGRQCWVGYTDHRTPPMVLACQSTACTTRRRTAPWCTCS